MKNSTLSAHVNKSEYLQAERIRGLLSTCTGCRLDKGEKSQLWRLNEARWLEVGLEEVRADFFLNVSTCFPCSCGSPFCTASFFMGCKAPLKNQILEPRRWILRGKKRNAFMDKGVIQQYMEIRDALHVTTWGALVAARIFLSGGKENQISVDSSRTAWGEFLAALLMKCYSVDITPSCFTWQELLAALTSALMCWDASSQ